MPDTPSKIIELDSCLCSQIRAGFDFNLQPQELVAVAIDLKRELPEGVTVSSVTHQIIDFTREVELDVTAGILQSEKVYNNALSEDVGALSMVSGFVEGHCYLVNASITLSDGQILERSYRFKVRGA